MDMIAKVWVYAYETNLLVERVRVTIKDVPSTCGGNIGYLGAVSHLEGVRSALRTYSEYPKMARKRLTILKEP